MAVLGLGLAGCSSGNGSSSGSSGAEVTTLRLPLQAVPASLAVGGEGGGDSTLLLSVYDTIVRRGLDGAVTPGVAESWEYSDDRLTLTLTIRSGMTFSNGEAVDAAAVAASLEATRKGTSTASFISSISDVKASDASTVVVTLSRPDAALLPNLATGSGAVGAPSVLTAESSKLDPVGSGPYTIDKAASTAGALYSLKRNPNYWNVAAYPFETVEFRFMQDPVAVQNALLANQLDWANITLDQVGSFDTSKFTTGVSLPQAFGAVWLPDQAGNIIPALADVRVRQAINMAFDRDLIATSLNAGSSHPSNQVFSPLGEAFSEELLATNSFNVDGAKKLMADAGYASGFAVTMPSTPISVQYEATITQGLGDIGITVTWESVTLQDFYQKVFTGTYGMFFMFNGFAGSDPQDAASSLTGLFNPFQTMTPELQSLLDAANAAPEDQQAAAYRAVNEYLVDEAWTSPIVYATGSFVTTKGVTYTPPVVAGQSLLPFAPAGS